MRIAYADPTARWVPFAAVGFLTVAGWFGALFANTNRTSDLGTASYVATGIFVVSLIAVLLQGRAFWNGQVETVSVDGNITVTTMRWVGSGKRITFSVTDASEWNATAKHDDKTKLSTVSFRVKGEVLSMSFLSPKVVDVELLSAMAPAFFAKLRADFPGLTSVQG